MNSSASSVSMNFASAGETPRPTRSSSIRISWSDFTSWAWGRLARVLFCGDPELVLGRGDIQFQRGVLSKRDARQQHGDETPARLESSASPVSPSTDSECVARTMTIARPPVRPATRARPRRRVQPPSVRAAGPERVLYGRSRGASTRRRRVRSGETMAKQTTWLFALILLGCAAATPRTGRRAAYDTRRSEVAGSRGGRSRNFRRRPGPRRSS